MALLSDVYCALQGLIDEIENMGMGQWTLKLPIITDNPSIEDYRNLMPHITHLLLLFPKTCFLEIMPPKIDDMIKFQMKVHPLVQEQRQTILDHWKDRNSPLGIKEMEDGLSIFFTLSQETEKKQNLEKLMNRFGLNPMEAKEFYQDSLDEIKEKSRELGLVYKEKNWKEIHRLAHSIKGTAMNLEQDELRVHARELEKKAKLEKINSQEMIEFLKISKNICKKMLLMEGFS
ncbi:MAG: Hpt domain-containing protein [Spirochaetaceae bacterium]|jgi:HPt (histidine-containing phosphotransfer) domain-containing protein|nr:Hpt domain-containing protein [Spirochaetaceae bacterium]